MAIKVRHDGNNAAVIAAGAGSGRAKRRVETAKLAQNTPQHIQTLQPAHASAPGAGGGSAPLTHAPTGASVASAPLTHAPTPTQMGGGGAGSRASSARGGGAGVDLGEVKVTGNSFFTRPDKESQWNPATQRWERPWLPGEKEAEAAQRMNPVLAERAEFQQALNDQSTESKMRLQGELAEQAAQRDRELYDYKLTRKQKMELSAINDALEEARASGRFSPDEIAELEKQALVRRAGIKPLPTPREKDAQKAFDERIVTAGGVQGYINSKGDFEPFQKDDGFASFLKVYPKLAEYTEDTTTTDPATGKTMVVPVTKTRSAAEIAELVKGAQEAWNRAKPQDTVPGSAPTESGIDPVIRQALDPMGMMFPQSAGRPAQAQPPVGPYAPPPPPTPEETRKKWSAFKAQ